jgi:glycosyltransferase involved in cell wall biosynthesis
MIYYTFEGNTILLREAEALCERGDKVDILCIGRNSIGKKVLNKNLTIYRLQKRNFNEKKSITYLLRHLRFFIKSFLISTKLHIQKRYNIIHITSPPDFLVFSAILLKLTGAKIILDIHDINPEFYMRKFGVKENSYIVKYLLILERLAVKYADHVITVTDIWKKKIVERTKITSKKCTVVMNVPSEIFINNDKTKKNVSKKFKMLYPGSLGEHFGVDTLVKSISVVNDKINNFVLYIYGDGHQKKYLKNIAKSLNLNSKIVFHDTVPREELIYIMKDVDLGIVPTKNGIFSDEALSGKSLEFLSIGTPIIMSKTMVSNYYYNDKIVKFFKPGNYKDLAKAIEELYYDAKKRKTLSQNGLRFTKKHNWLKYKKVYYEIIDNLLYG